MLFQLQREMGNRWCEICKEIPGRTENMVKNRWYSSARKKWYVVFESCLYISHYHENITAIINLYYKEITRPPTLECTLECHEKLHSRFALEHRYAKKGLKLDLSKKAPKLPRKKKPTPKKKTKPRKERKKKKKTKKKINKSEENTMDTMSLTLDDDDLISFPTTKTGSLEPQNNTKAVIDFLQMGGG